MLELNVLLNFFNQMYSLQGIYFVTFENPISVKTSQMATLFGVFEQNLDIYGKTYKTNLTLPQLKAKVEAYKFPHTKK